MTFGDMGTEGPLADKVMHGQLETPAGYTIMGADTPDEMPFQPGNTVTVSLSGDDTFGMCNDRFGTGWMVNIAGSRGDAAGAPADAPGA